MKEEEENKKQPQVPLLGEEENPTLTPLLLLLTLLLLLPLPIRFRREEMSARLQGSWKTAAPRTAQARTDSCQRRESKP
jgi:hypothetical protein